METIRVRTWNGFVRRIEQIRAEYGEHIYELENDQKFRHRPRILFRGHPDSAWHLQTTLERATSSKYHVLRYLEAATRHSNEIESFTSARWNVPRFPELESQIVENQDTFRVHLPAYPYLVYLRHHGFPSPLLDWTESPYIAAYFALAEDSGNSSAVYCYIERPRGGKGGIGGQPMITVFGPFVTTHQRHFAQKAWYTVATRWDYGTKRHTFTAHEPVFGRNEREQDLLFKIVLPRSERLRGLRQLSDYNINHFTLFQTEDSLIKTLALRQFDLGDSDDER
jgi:hypothetical protein